MYRKRPATRYGGIKVGLPLFRNNELFGVHRIAICVLHDFLLDMNSDLGRNFISGFGDSYSSVPASRCKFL